MFIWEYPSRSTVSQTAQQKSSSATDGVRFTNLSVKGSLRNLFRFRPLYQTRVPKETAATQRLTATCPVTTSVRSVT
jgi:hypothetical protein